MTTIPFKMVRAPDCSPELHRATDRYEQAVDTLLASDTVEETEAARSAYDAARRGYAAEFLATDKRRRPEFYARGN
jgi:hypothetical protein